MNRSDAQALASGELSRLPHELKVSLRPGDLPRLLQALEAEPSKAKRRTVWLFDTPARALGKSGLMLRLRHKKDEADFTVKVRPVQASRLDGAWLKSRALEVEADVVAGRALLSASIEREVEQRPAVVDRALASPLQQALLRDAARVAVPWADLRITRPATVSVWKLKPLVIERWELPDGQLVLEVSATLPGTQLEAQRVALDQLLDTAKVRRANEQVTKSERLLQTLPKT